MELFAFALVLALAYANGSNETSKSIATLVGSSVMRYKAAMLRGAGRTVIGAGASVFIAGAMVERFSRSLVRSDTIFSPAAVLSIVAGRRPGYCSHHA